MGPYDRYITQVVLEATWFIAVSFVEDYLVLCFSLLLNVPIIQEVLKNWYEYGNLSLRKHSKNIDVYIEVSGEYI